MQMYTSKNTSLNQIPALIKKALPYMNGANFDNGVEIKQGMIIAQ